MTNKLEQWAMKTSKRRIVLQITGKEGPELWRAEVIDESGSTVLLTFGENAHRALIRVDEAFGRRRAR